MVLLLIRDIFEFLYFILIILAKLRLIFIIPFLIIWRFAAFALRNLTLTIWVTVRIRIAIVIIHLREFHLQILYRPVLGLRWKWSALLISVGVIVLRVLVLVFFLVLIVVLLKFAGALFLR